MLDELLYADDMDKNASAAAKMQTKAVIIKWHARQCSRRRGPAKGRDAKHAYS